MTEGGTHCNVAGHVVPATVVSWFAPSFSVLRGTTPGAFRRITRKSMLTACTRTMQVRRMRQQARHEVTLWHSMMEGGSHCNVAGHVVPAMLVSWLPSRYSALRGTTAETVRDRVAPHRSKRKSMPTVCTRTTQVRGMQQQALIKRPSRHSMMEGGTHCNVVGHVVPAMLVSWFP